MVEKFRLFHFRYILRTTFTRNYLEMVQIECCSSNKIKIRFGGTRPLPRDSA